MLVACAVARNVVTGEQSAFIMGCGAVMMVIGLIPHWNKEQ